MTTTTRPMHWQDIPALLALEETLFPTDAWGAASWWSELAGRPRREYVVAEDDGQVVGYAGLDHGGEVADIMTVAVSPTAQGRGLGSELVDDLLTRAVTGGAHQVMLEVRADNPRAETLYAHKGFDVVTRRRRYYQPGDVDALVMRRVLPEVTA